MTFGPEILIPILLVFGTAFLVMVAIGTGFVAGLIAIGYSLTGRPSPNRLAEADVPNPGLAVFDTDDDVELTDTDDDVELTDPDD